MIKRQKEGLAALILVFAGLVIFIGVAFFWYQSNTENEFAPSLEIASPDTRAEDNVADTGQDLSPTPFYELTVPYLRGREYDSKLGETSLYRQHNNYSSYLTSYVSDGFVVNGLLTIPDTEPPQGGFPAVVFVHGYIAPSIYRTTERYVDYVDYLARNGFVVFKIDLRGHGASEGEPRGAYYSSDYVIDTLNAYAALQSTDFVNPRAIGLWGHSMAGNVTMRAFVANQNIPALVVWAGAVYTYEDFAEYRLSDNSYRPPSTDTNRARYRQQIFETHGQFDAESDFWRQVPPVNYLDGVAGAVQIHHAVDDSVVDVRYSRNLSEVLDQYGISQEYYEYSTGGHNLTGVSFVTAMRRTVDFYNTRLQ